MKCQSQFSRKNNINISKCHLLNCLPSTLSINRPIQDNKGECRYFTKIFITLVLYFTVLLYIIIDCNHKPEVLLNNKLPLDKVFLYKKYVYFSYYSLKYHF